LSGTKGSYWVGWFRRGSLEIHADYGLLGDKSNHIPSLHIPQLYYFIVAATFFGWPVLISGAGGASTLGRNVWNRMFGSNRYARSRWCM